MTSRFLPALFAVACLAPLAAGAQGGGASAIALEIETDRDYYREGAAAEIYAQVRLRTAELDPEAAREPVRNVAFLIDRSGSMDGERMAATQTAVAAALDQLADRDFAAVVLFGSEVETLVEAQRGGEAREQFSRLGPIEAAGGAALYDGLSQAAAQLRRHASRGTLDQIILVADGPATRGPRGREDFVGLVQALAREGVVLSTIGLGEDFDEDLLAAMARAGGGRFHFVAEPERPPPAESALAAALAAEVAPRGGIVALDAVLTIEYRSFCDDVRAHGARPATVERQSVTYRFAPLTAGQELQVLVSGRLEAFRTTTSHHDLVRARLRWTDPVDGGPREATAAATVRFSPEPRDALETINTGVYRAAVAAMIGEGMREAIEQLDKGDLRRALAMLRRARTRARDANFQVDDPEIRAMAARLEAYIADVQARGPGALDRKLLRSGLHNAFETPEDDASKR